MTHVCHARGCDGEAHPEMPFCARHANMLPEPHKLRLWRERRKGGCGACEIPMDGDLSEDDKTWLMLYDLGTAMLLLIEFGNDSFPPSCGCGAPRALRDEQGFCWACGVPDSEHIYDVARKAMKKYKVQVQASF